MAESYKQIHDLLLQKMPTSASHESGTCPFCANVEAASEEEKVSAEKIYSQEQLDSVLKAAVDVAVADAKKEADAELLQANSELEALKASVATHEARIKDFESEIEQREEQERIEALATDRVKEIRVVASFTDEQVDARKERWAKMTEDDFKALIEDYREIASGRASNEGTKKSSLFDGTRQTAGENNTELGAVRQLLGLAPVGGE